MNALVIFFDIFRITEYINLINESTLYRFIFPHPVFRWEHANSMEREV
jgi:hypothetical protein